MVKVFTHGLMAQNMKAHFKMIKCMVQELKYIKMETFIKVNFLKINFKDKEHIVGQMEINTQEILKMDYHLEKGKKSGVLEKSMKVIFLMDK